MDEAILELVDFVKVASPVVWAAARQQVTVGICQGVLWIAIMLFMFVGCVALYKHEEEEADDFFFVGSIIVGFFMLILVLVVLTLLIGPIFNPDYYAIKALWGLMP